MLRILVDNALRYAGPPVDMAVTADPDGVAVAVRDRGPGVPVDERELVFERFRRGRSAAPEGGFGLGLAIARELAERMHGRLNLEDADPGARFVLELPAAEPELVRDDHDLDGDAPAGGEPEEVPERSGARQ